MDRLFKSRKTVLELLSDRGYSSESLRMTLEKFKTSMESKTYDEIKNEMGFLLQGKDDNDDNDILISWSIPPKLGAQECTNLVCYMKKMDVSRAVIIIEQSVTHCARKTLESLRYQKPQIYIDIFTITETQFNISHHKWVPAHIICSEKKKRSVMKEYSVNESQLPNILITDPMARYLGATKGQLVMITRDSDTMIGQKTITYRIVA